MMRRLLLLSAVVVSGALVSSVPAIQADDAIKQKIIDSWRAREARFETGMIQFQNTESYPAGKGPGGRSRKQPLDVVLTHLFVFDGVRGRYERSGEMWDVDAGQLMHKDYVATFNGELSFAMFQDRSLGNHPAGRIRETQTIQGAGSDYHIDPVVLAFRPLTKQLNGVDPSGWRDPPHYGEINGTRVLVFRDKFQEYSVDPARDHIVVRRDTIISLPPDPGKMFARLDLNYREDSKLGWMPTDWTFIEFSETSDDVAMTMRGNVASAEFNRPVDPRVFEVEFPAGTIVHSEPENMKAVVRKDGSLRKIDAGEVRAGVAYDDMMITDPPSVVESRSRRMRYDIYLGLLTLVIAIVVYRHRVRLSK